MAIEGIIPSPDPKIREFILSTSLRSAYLISGAVEKGRGIEVDYNRFAAIFPEQTGYNFVLIADPSLRNLPMEDKLKPLRELLDLELPDRVANIPKDEPTYTRIMDSARQAGYPIAAVGWGIRADDKSQVITLFVLKGASPKEEFAKIKEKLITVLSKRIN